MDWAAHQITGSIINQAMAGDGVFAGKNHGDDVDMVMAAAITGAGMAGMQVRVVADGQGCRLQHAQALAEQFDRRAAHAGSAFLNGLTVTFSYTPAAM